jgi:hypothetical protein
VVSAELTPGVNDEPSIELSAESPVEASVEVAADASGEPALDESAADESAEQVRDEELLDAEDERADLPDFRRRPPGRATLAVLVGSAAALVVASVAWSQFASRGEHSAARNPAPVPERHTPERAPERPNPEPVPSPATPVTNEVASTPAPTLEGALGTSLEKAVTTVAVTIRTVPAGAVIFRAGERLGTGVVEVSVERKLKQRFTALLDGYTPSNFTLDGSRDSVTVVLRRAPKRRAAPAPESDSPYGEPSADSNAVPASAPTAAPAPAAAPAPESTTPAAPSPDVSPAVSSPE